MAKTKRKTIDAAKQVRNLTTPEMRQHGDFEFDHLVVDPETRQKLGVVRNRGGFAIDRWRASMKAHHLVALGHCERLWADIAERSSLYRDEGSASGTSALGQRQQIAFDMLARYANRCPPPAANSWGVFENVARHGWSGADAGKALAGNDRDRAAAAKYVTLMVLGIVADELGA